MIAATSRLDEPRLIQWLNEFDRQHKLPPFL
jgi:hypothetical protein